MSERKRKRSKKPTIFTIEYICDHQPKTARQHKGTQSYLVKWLGYVEPEWNCAHITNEDAPIAVNEYWKDSDVENSDANDNKADNSDSNESDEADDINSKVQDEVAKQLKEKHQDQEHCSKMYGQPSIEDHTKFNKLPQHEKDKYVEGKSFTKIFRPDPKNKRAMCCWYKGIAPDKTCSSKNFDNMMDKYLSQKAEWVHVELIKKADRLIRADKIRTDLYNHALCTACKNQVGGQMLNITNLHFHCSICKQYYTKTNSTQITLPVCKKCYNALSLNEDLVYKSIESIKNILPHKIKNFQIIRSKRTNKKTYIVDFKITFEVNGKKGIILLEVDESQHSSYDKKKEIDRNEHLINEQMADLFNIKIADYEKKPFKLMLIRFSPDDSYKYPSFESIMQKNDTKDCRIVILRQWIFWFMFELEKVREFSIIYLFYNMDKDSKKKKYGHNYRGTLFANFPPKADYGDEKNWLYCYDPGEIACKAFEENVYKNANVVNNVFPCWKMKRDGERFPNHLKNYLKDHFKTSDLDIQ